MNVGLDVSAGTCTSPPEEQEEGVEEQDVWNATIVSTQVQMPKNNWRSDGDSAIFNAAF